jgi:KDEL-tailed cysteine endopeptidase
MSFSFRSLLVFFGYATATCLARVTTATGVMTFDAFRLRYGKTYARHELGQRREIFEQNMRTIADHNRQARDHGFTMVANRFADSTEREYASMLGTVHAHADVSVSVALRSTSVQQMPPRRQTPVPPDLHPLPAALDWRDQHAVTPVKDQGKCGSCWSFSAVEAVESAYAIATGRLVVLSEQQLVSCSTENSGCSGGMMDTAFRYMEVHGVATEASYPYEGVDDHCNTNWTPAVRVTGYRDVPRRDEPALRAAVARQPVSVAIEADQSVFQFYDRGVISSGCGTDLDHGVLLVGYGTENGTDYWLVRNSWGTGWGDGGYVKLRRTNRTNTAGACGIALGASYPTVAVAGSDTASPPPQQAPSAPTSSTAVVVRYTRLGGHTSHEG